MLGVMHDGIWVKLRDSFCDEVTVAEIADVAGDALGGDPMPCADSFVEAEDRDETVHTELLVPTSADKVVHDSHLMANRRQIEGGRPTQVAVTAKH